MGRGLVVGRGRLLLEPVSTGRADVGRPALDYHRRVVTPLTTLLVGAVLGAVLGFLVSLLLTRPTLKLTGGRHGHHVDAVAITNRPGLFGWDLGERVVFAKLVHGRIRRVLTIDRSPAANCTAWIHERGQNAPFSGLYWRPGSGEFLDKVTIASGESVWLYVFAQSDDYPDRYFVFAPESGTSATPQKPRLTFGDTKQFVLHIQMYGRSVARFDVTMLKGPDGKFHFQRKG